MKKILAVLVVLAMALSLSAVAFADTNSYLKLTAIDTEATYVQGNFTTAIGANETVSFDFRPDSCTRDTWEGLSIRSYHYVAKLVYINATYDETTGDFTGYEVSFDGCAPDGIIDTNSVKVTAGADGWYNVSMKFVADQAEGLFVRYYTKDADAAKNVCDVDNFKVGSKVCSFNEANVSELADNALTLLYDDGSELGYVRDSGAHWKGELASEEVTPAGGEEETEDVTEGVEETGVVSVAVVAVAAVVGGAVVLKKREF